jgi:putative transposase
MILTESHILNSSPELNIITFNCKNLYNKANYIIRQEFITNGKYIQKFDMFTISKDLDEYKILPTRVARTVLRTLDANWKSFFSCIKKWKSNKELFKGKPNLPKYLPKNGKFTAIFIDSAILKPNKENKIGLSSLKTRIQVQTKGRIIEVQLVPLQNKTYKINIIYDYKEKELKTNNNNYCSIDLGIDNLMTVTSNKKGIKPIVVNGRPLKSINQYYNKKKSKLQSKLPEKTYKSNRINRLTEKRYRKVNDYLHKSSKKIIDFCLENGLNTIVIGYNEFWKQEVNIGKRNNQNFVSIPFNRLVSMIEYKAKMFGLNVIINEESYTSKCSFLDKEEIKKHEVYKGKRIKRGLYRSSTGRIINSDVNGSYNILVKVVPNAFVDGIEDVAVHPMVYTIDHKHK